MSFTTRCHGFTLLETILVLLVVSVLMALGFAGYTTTIQSTAVNTGAATLCDALSEARQSAVAQNTTVEVRIYDVPPTPGTAATYSAMQLHWLKADGTTPAVALPVLLPTLIAIDATTTYSPLIASNTQSPTADASDPRLNNQTRVFHFLPDGSTDLNPTTSWFMTVRAASQSDPAHFPSNWACVAVDATTGRARVYRP